MIFCPTLRFIKSLLILICFITFCTTVGHTQMFVEEPVEIHNSSENIKVVQYNCISKISTSKFKIIKEHLISFTGINQVSYNDSTNILSVNCTNLWKPSDINSQLIRTSVHVVGSSIDLDVIKIKAGK